MTRQFTEADEHEFLSEYASAPISTDPDAPALLVQFAEESGIDIEEVTPEEGFALLDRAARRHLHIGAEEFIADWHAGKFDNAERSEIMTVAMLLPFAGE